MVDEDSHSTDLSVSGEEKLIPQFYWLITFLVLIEDKVI